MNPQDLLFPIAFNWHDIDVSDIANPNSVAVIMRTKNRPVLLARAINSVLSQVHQDWHLYVVNDGGDAEVVERVLAPYCAAFCNRLTVIHNAKSVGMEAASNCAFRQIHEAFMVVHDDDDSWHPDFLLETVAFLHQNSDAVAVLTNIQTVYETIIGDTVKRTGVEDWWYNHQRNVDVMHLIKGNVAPPIGLLIRTQAARAAGFYNEDLPVLGDWDYNLRLFRIGEIKKLSKTLAYYHQRPSATDTQSYGNSIFAGEEKHFKYQIAYRNALVRAALQSDIGNFGLLHLLMQSNTGYLEYRLNCLSRDVEYLCRKSFPLKRFAKKVRDKIRKVRGKL